LDLRGTTHAFQSNCATQTGGAINNTGAGTVNLFGSNEFTDNTANASPNDIHNDGTFNLGSVVSDSSTISRTSASTPVHVKTTLSGGVTGSGSMYLHQGELHLAENRQIHQGKFETTSQTRTFVTINSNHLVQEKGIDRFADLGNASVAQSKMAKVIERKGYSIHTTGTMNLKSDSVLHVDLKNSDLGKTYLIAYNEDENQKPKAIDNEATAWKDKNITIISSNPMLSFYRVEGDAENGFVMISSEESNSVDVIEDLGSHKPMYYGWLSDLSDLRHRIGEVRYGAQDGLWVKGVYSRYRASGLGEGNLKAKDYSVHLGLDHQIVEDEDKSWLLGMSFKAGRLDLDSNRSDGSGDTDHYMLKGYATYFNKSGSYLDIVASLGYFDNEFTGFHDVYSGYMKGEYDNWGYGLSLEGGHMFSWGEDIDDRQWHNHWFFEPQFQLSYLRIQGEEFDTSVGIHVDQKNTNYLTGRLGGVFGKKFNYGDENSLDKRFLQIGARAGWIHEFKGDQSLKMNGVKYTGKTADDVFYYGLDVDWQFGQNQKCYLQVDRAHGSGYRKEVQVRLGYRYEF
ncbi:MAG: autotransporter outer membrane beta-barrel domain-containing protein, partial [Burkholderiaceae bacterium]|nr:autotransporter outer membrane beta-barrel domain-containing protein [Burkholderiaceae bacterium]